MLSSVLYLVCIAYLLCYSLVSYACLCLPISTRNNLKIMKKSRDQSLQYKVKKKQGGYHALAYIGYRDY